METTTKESDRNDVIGDSNQANEEETTPHSDSIVIDDLTVIGEKETISLLRANRDLFKDWKCAQSEDVSVPIFFGFCFFIQDYLCRILFKSKEIRDKKILKTLGS